MFNKQGMLWIPTVQKGWIFAALLSDLAGDSVVQNSGKNWACNLQQRLRDHTVVTGFKQHTYPDSNMSANDESIPMLYFF